MRYLPIQARNVHFLVSSKRSSDSSKNHTCPVENINDPRACLAFSLLLSIFLIFRHATHYSMPREQKQYTLPLCSILSTRVF
ncbi:hypothetical protein BELL_0444g00060 [Botrytis elliptica]|uniref:Uncharacterized protein n=1 Tax=Botrytis elliptica TaxID=278938 RepID=A0A4Z1JFF6_9HELO|nr:hypothetical protein BELL_0444g00060 [Botrytis elliptica]